MIPVQDVLPSGRTPGATLTLLAINLATFAWLRLSASGPADILVWLPFVHVSAVHLAINAVCLWIFGDNVEARLGAWRFIATYLLCGAIGTAVHLQLLGTSSGPPLAATAAVAGIAGAYALLLPDSRVLVLVPAPPVLVEMPMVVLLASWWMLQFAYFVAVPAFRLNTGGMTPIWSLLSAFLVGIAVARLLGHPFVWPREKPRATASP